MTESKYAKRNITSNWAKYDVPPEDDEDAVVDEQDDRRGNEEEIKRSRDVRQAKLEGGCEMDNACD